MGVDEDKVYSVLVEYVVFASDESEAYDKLKDETSDYYDWDVIRIQEETEPWEK